MRPSGSCHLPLSIKFTQLSTDDTYVWLCTCVCGCVFFKDDDDNSEGVVKTKNELRNKICDCSSVVRVKVSVLLLAIKWCSRLVSTHYELSVSPTHRPVPTTLRDCVTYFPCVRSVHTINCPDALSVETVYFLCRCEASCKRFVVARVCFGITMTKIAEVITVQIGQQQRSIPVRCAPSWYPH